MKRRSPLAGEAQANNRPTLFEQADVDRLLHGGTPEASDARKLPKGLTAQTLRTLCQWIDAHPDVEFSTDELAAAVNISRVSCRKYLIWLAQINILSTHYPLRRHRAWPVYRYRLVAEQYSLPAVQSITR